MKVTVIRSLTSGVYYIGFRVGDFTEEERLQMKRFGIPQIGIYFGGPTSRASAKQPLTQLSNQQVAPAGFVTEEEAKKYEAVVVDQIRKAAALLKEQKDNFTSTDEVEI